jgi:hypothetical protein
LPEGRLAFQPAPFFAGRKVETAILPSLFFTAHITTSKRAEHHELLLPTTDRKRRRSDAMKTSKPAWIVPAD